MRAPKPLHTPHRMPKGAVAKRMNIRFATAPFLIDKTISPDPIVLWEKGSSPALLTKAQKETVAIMRRSPLSELCV